MCHVYMLSCRDIGEKGFFSNGWYSIDYLGNVVILFPGPQNLGKDTLFVTFACLVAEIHVLEKNDFSVMAALVCIFMSIVFY